MSKRLIIVLAAALVLGLVVGADAAVQNVKVSGDLEILGVSRTDFDLGVDERNEDSDVIMSIIRVRIDADLTDNVSTTLRLINERDWGLEEDNAADDTGIDLDLAYITLKEMLYSPLTMTIGRQEIRFGNGFVLGDVNTNRTAVAVPGVQNRDLITRKAFDAIRSTLDYDPLVIDLIYSKIDANTKVQGDDNDDIDLYAFNANYSFGDEWGTVAEAYYLYEKSGKGIYSGGAGEKTGKIHTPGVRVSTNPIEGLNLQGEVAIQRGTMYMSSQRYRNREAWAAQAQAHYVLPFEKTAQYEPVVSLIYSFYSGDKNPDDVDVNNPSKYKAWDSLYEDQTAGHIINVLFDATNSHVLNAKLAMKTPIEDVTLTMDYVALWLDRKLDSDILTLYQPSGTNLTTASMNIDDDMLGQEFDIKLTYDYTEDVQFGLLAGWFNPGHAFDKANKTSASELIGSCAVSF